MQIVISLWSVTAACCLLLLLPLPFPAQQKDNSVVNVLLPYSTLTCSGE